MAHTCPDCWQMCYCGGDIDDCCFDDTPEQRNCSHPLKCQPPDEDDEDVFGECVHFVSVNRHCPECEAEGTPTVERP